MSMHKVFALISKFHLPKGRKRGFSPITILFIAAAIAIVLVAFMSFQIQSSSITPSARIHSSEVERGIREAKFLSTQMAIRSSELSTNELGSAGGSSNGRYWQCNSLYPSNKTALEISFCDDSARIYQKFFQLSGSPPYCLLPEQDGNNSFSILLEGQELSYSDAGIYTSQSSPYHVHIKNNRYFHIAEKMREWALQNSLDELVTSELSKPCQMRQCSCIVEEGNVLSNSLTEKLLITNDSLNQLIEESVFQLSSSFENENITCTYEIKKMNITNTNETATEQIRGCSCGNPETNNMTNWEELNGEDVDEPECEYDYSSLPLQCAPFLSVSLYDSNKTYLKEFSRGIGPLVQRCSFNRKGCALNSNATVISNSTLSEQEENSTIEFVHKGGVAIVEEPFYETLAIRLEGEKIFSQHPENSSIGTSHFLYGDGIFISLPSSLNANNSREYSELALSIINSELIGQLEEEPCPISSTFTMPHSEKTLYSMDHAMHAMHDRIAVSRHVEMDFAVTCTDELNYISSEEGIIPLEFTINLYINKKKDCPLPEICPDLNICEG